MTKPFRGTYGFDAHNQRGINLDRPVDDTDFAQKLWVEEQVAAQSRLRGTYTPDSDGLEGPLPVLANLVPTVDVLTADYWVVDLSGRAASDPMAYVNLNSDDRLVATVGDAGVTACTLNPALPAGLLPGTQVRFDVVAPTYAGQGRSLALLLDVDNTGQATGFQIVNPGYDFLVGDVLNGVISNTYQDAVATYTAALGVFSLLPDTTYYTASVTGGTGASFQANFRTDATGAAIANIFVINNGTNYTVADVLTVEIEGQTIGTLTVDALHNGTGVVCEVTVDTVGTTTGWDLIRGPGLTREQADRDYLRLDGGNEPSENIGWNNQRITDLADPIDPQDAVNLRSLPLPVGAFDSIDEVGTINLALAAGDGLLLAVVQEGAFDLTYRVRSEDPFNVKADLALKGTFSDSPTLGGGLNLVQVADPAFAWSGIRVTRQMSDFYIWMIAAVDMPNVNQFTGFIYREPRYVVAMANPPVVDPAPPGVLIWEQEFTRTPSPALEYIPDSRHDPGNFINHAGVDYRVTGTFGTEGDKPPSEMIAATNAGHGVIYNQVWPVDIDGKQHVLLARIPAYAALNFLIGGLYNGRQAQFHGKILTTYEAAQIEVNYSDRQGVVDELRLVQDGANGEPWLLYLVVTDDGTSSWDMNIDLSGPGWIKATYPTPLVSVFGMPPSTGTAVPLVIPNADQGFVSSLNPTPTLTADAMTVVSPDVEHPSGGHYTVLRYNFASIPIGTRVQIDFTIGWYIPSGTPDRSPFWVRTSGGVEERAILGSAGVRNNEWAVQSGTFTTTTVSNGNMDIQLRTENQAYVMRARDDQWTQGVVFFFYN